MLIVKNMKLKIFCFLLVMSCFLILYSIYICIILMYILIKCISKIWVGKKLVECKMFKGVY